MNDVRMQDVSHVVGTLYEAAHDAKVWPSAIDELRKLFNGSMACLVPWGSNVRASDVNSSTADPTYLQRYIDDFGSGNELLDALQAVPVRHVYRDHDLLGHHAFRRTRFWNEWMAPQDMYGGLACKLEATPSSIWMFDVQRGRRQAAFDDNDAKLLRHLVPHFLRVRQISRHLELTTMVASAFSHLSFGIILVDSQMRIVASNEVANAIFDRRGSQIRNKNGALWTKIPSNLANLRQLVANVCNIGSRSARGPGGEHLLRSNPLDLASVNLAVSVRPLFKGRNPGAMLPPCAALLLREINLQLGAEFQEQIRALFALSPKEARVAIALASGHSLKQTAQDERIAFSTARSYLEHIFYKTNTRSQGQLVALLKTIHPVN